MRLLRVAFAGSVLLAAFGGLVALSFGVIVTKREGNALPDHSHLADYVPALASKMVASDGKFLARFAEENRKLVLFPQMPPLVVDAFVSAEDRNYWKHAGVDWIAVLRAGLTNFRERAIRDTDKRPEGGSSITQQVAKNLVVGDERTIRRKIREALVALKIDRDLGKQRVLEIYLNEVYLGAGSYGVGAAAEIYFGKQVGQLKVEEAALLAGLPKMPSAADPFRHPERAKERRNYVLRRLAEDGKIRPEEAERAIASPIVLVRREEKPSVSSDWFVAEARKSLVAAVGKDILMRGGYEISTTLDAEMQRWAEAALRRGVEKADRMDGWRGVLARLPLPVKAADLPPPPPGAAGWSVAAVTSGGSEAELLLSDGTRRTLTRDGVAWTRRSVGELLRPGDVVLVEVGGPKGVELQQVPQVEGALVALDPRSGDVKALVGGFSRDSGEFDRATQARRQPGSAFKTFTYLAALGIGYDPLSPVLDVAFAGEQGPGQALWRPGSYGGGGGMGMMPMFKALEKSRNLAAIRLLNEVGTGPVGDLVRTLGIDAPNPLPLAAGLGAVETTPLSMAAAYAAIANGGRVVRPRFVTAMSGSVVPKDIDLGGVGLQVMTQIETAMMQSMLRGVVERGTARAAFAGFKGWVAGKTGTTNASKDVWFVGFSPEIVVAVWIGRDDSRPLPGKLTGGATAAPVARDFLEAAAQKIPLSVPPLPVGVKIVKVDPETGEPSKARNAIDQIVRLDTGSPVPLPSSSPPSVPDRVGKAKPAEAGKSAPKPLVLPPVEDDADQEDED